MLLSPTTRVQRKYTVPSRKLGDRTRTPDIDVFSAAIDSGGKDQIIGLRYNNTGTQQKTPVSYQFENILGPSTTQHEVLFHKGNSHQRYLQKEIIRNLLAISPLLHPVPLIQELSY